MIKHRRIPQLIVAVAACASVGAATGPVTSSAAAAPTVKTEAASGVGQTSATLNASVNPNGEKVTECKFEYGKTIAYEASVPCSPMPTNETESVSVSGVVNGLSPGTTYHFRIVAAAEGGAVPGEDLSFTTLAVPPTVHTEAASGVGQTSATVSGTVNANGEEIKECWLEYGISDPHEAKAPCNPMPAPGAEGVAVAAELQGLSPNTTYHFTVVAVNTHDEKSEGEELQFTTLAPAPATVQTSPPGGTAQTSSASNAVAAYHPVPPVEALVRAPLLAHISTRVNGRVLELRFHLSVRSRVRLLAKRGRKVVARTGWRTLAAGDHRLLLRLNLHRWPKRLNLQTHALEPLPLITVKERAALG